MGDGSSQIVCGDSHNEIKNYETFPANVFLLNPPYSAPGKGLIFVYEALSKMEKGYGAVLIQENAGNGQGDVYAKKLLENNTLLASVHMPGDLFNGKSSVQTAIYLFKVNRKHEKDDMVTFIDFSKDGYTRQNRKKSTQEVNLRNTDNALERYDEVCAICLGKKPKTKYYTEENGLVIKDTITLNGDDWTFTQHKKIDTVPKEADFKKTVSEFLAWEVSNIIKGEAREISLKKATPRSMKLSDVEWGEFKFSEIFNHIQQGRRLKKEDQIQGDIPFVMSGTTNTGLVNYISNPITIFPKNSITVDIFGNTFYRNYEFGAGDDTGVYWNDKENYSEKVMLFLTVAMQISLSGRFSYGKKLRSSQSFDFTISLPIKNNKIDFDFMEKYIAELEAERIAELDAYLKVTGLEDYELIKCTQGSGHDETKGCAFKK